MLEVIEAKILALDGVAHGFFTSLGGVSTGVYASLNTGPGSSDDPSLVAENRRRATEHLAGPGACLSTLYQVHGRRVVEVTGPWSGQA
ncbi:MAG: laccase domain-containing protein, partial [Sphingomonadales bacterium]